MFCLIHRLKNDQQAAMQNDANWRKLGIMIPPQRRQLAFGNPKEVNNITVNIFMDFFLQRLLLLEESVSA